MKGIWKNWKSKDESRPSTGQKNVANSAVTQTSVKDHQLTLV